MENKALGEMQHAASQNLYGDFINRAFSEDRPLRLISSPPEFSD